MSVQSIALTSRNKVSEIASSSPPENESKSTSSQTFKVFFSYTRKDEWLREKLETHLALLKRQGLITGWSDRQITPGMDWESEIDVHLETADIILLLISAEFLASDYCYGKEMMRAMERHQARNARVIPIILSACEWKEAPFGRLQVLPTDGRPIMGWEKQDEALYNIAQGLRNVIVDELIPQPLVAISDTDAGMEENEQVDQIPVIAVMGTSGGAGKGTFVSCAAQLIADGGHDVAVVDFDLEASGTTRAAEELFGARNPHTRTVFDHIAPHSEGFDTYQVSRREVLWDISPGYLQERGRGKIFLLPAAEPACYRFGWDITANLTPPREEKLRELTQEMLDRIRREYPGVRCILIDCGAGTNPIFSAAFACADFGYIITRPQAKYFETIRAIREVHSRRYPEDNLDHISVVVNRYTTQADIDRCKLLDPKGHIPDNPTLQADVFAGGAVDYDLGYNDVFMAVRNCLAADLKGQLVPDEKKVRLDPWWMLFVEGKLAARILQSAAFRRWTLLTRGLTLVSAIALVGLLTVAAWQQFVLPVQARNALDMVLIGASAALLTLVLSIGKLMQHEQKRRLLQHVDRLSAEAIAVQHQFLDELLKQADRSLLRWLKALHSLEQQQQKFNRQRALALSD